jgi:hypothetical protein
VQHHILAIMPRSSLGFFWGMLFLLSYLCFFVCKVRVLQQILPVFGIHAADGGVADSTTIPWGLGAEFRPEQYYLVVRFISALAQWDVPPNLLWLGFADPN